MFGFPCNRRSHTWDCVEPVEEFCSLHIKQYFGEIKNELFLKNELFFKDPEDVYSRSARPSASYTY